MIVFNLAAILVVLIAALLCIPIIIIYALGGMNEKMLVICASWMILVASFIGKAKKIDGRLFFIPMWILSIPIPFIFTYATYKWSGIGVTFGIFAFFVGLMMFYTYKREKKRLNNLGSERIDFSEHAMNPIAYWEAVKEKFFSPTFIKMTPEISRFNLKIVKVLENENIQLRHLEAYKNEMKKIGAHHENLDSEVTKKLMDEIDLKIIDLKEKAKLSGNL
ncbi:hypothetical protein [uncultured Kordia sp.]|uniref:hypothetical protein n=1 Tax=uncultured Kordia sp. TaxID=507699 RepID=UPI00260A458D|nr:hypothetical protein [uncultured Kordia sp.]